ncbi:hypothetical protein HanHA89_Chr09g0320861 [Helianthus annuus]|nr:hypothetical protein HanHA89_Chr09g0320861 [Helianthus annuus]
MYSGSKYPKLPLISSVHSISISAVVVDIPKSDTLATHLSSKRMLDVFTSLWMMVSLAPV